MMTHRNCVLQEGLQLTLEQQRAVLAVRKNVLMRLEEADALRRNAFTAIGRNLLWHTRVSPSACTIIESMLAFANTGQGDASALDVIEAAKSKFQYLAVQ